MKSIATLIAALAIAPTAAHAQVQITSCGYLIDRPGTYSLVTDLNCSGAVNDSGINITASNVKLTLNNHKITSTDPGHPLIHGISVVAPATPTFAPRLDHVSIVGPGQIIDVSGGVVLFNVDDSTVRDLTVLAPDNSDGIRAFGSNRLTVFNNMIGFATYGIFLENCDQSIVSLNTITATRGSALLLSGNGGQVFQNIVMGNQDGIVLEGSPSDFRVYQNTTVGNAQTGITVFGSVPLPNKVYSNRATGNKIYDLAVPCLGTSNNTFVTSTEPSCTH